MSGKEWWILVRDGRVQRLLSGTVGKVWPVAENHADAKRLAAWFRSVTPLARTVRPALVGSVAGETLEGHVQLALEDGCKAVYCVAGWNGDGSPAWKSIAFD